MVEVGRPRKPSSVKQAEGNRGKRDLNAGSLSMPIQIPEMPKRIVGEARLEWQRLASVLEENSLITKLDRTALIIYVDAFGIYTEAMASLKRKGIEAGLLQTTGKTNYETLSGLALIIRDARTTMLTIMTQFGMTPSSREKVSVVNNQMDAFDEKPSLN